MKKINVLFLTVSLIIIFNPSISTAGSYMLGMKGWYAFWDGSPDAISGIVDDDLDNGVEASLDPSFTGTVNSESSSSKSTGKGYLAGPMLAYQTDDRIWSFSLAFMYLSDFTYDTTSSGIFTIGPPENLNGINTLNYTIELKRREIDVAISRSISSRMKIYAGYKYQSIEETLDVKGTMVETTVPFSGSIDSTTDIKVTFHIPTAGIAFIFPMTDSIFLGVQAGLLYYIKPAYRTDTKDNNSGLITSESSYYESTLGINTEANISYLRSDKLLFQLGYRYQGARLKNESGSINVWDSFHGVTLSALYIFNP